MRLPKAIRNLTIPLPDKRAGTASALDHSRSTRVWLAVIALEMRGRPATQPPTEPFR